ncbi:Uncharacterized protein BP5553_03684 [Venustampulla echinocandica]|uniref:Bacteriophage T5 Orf172 DNA-binding domain-containing protein n=1 Tax=Venustampulla echinocandica TaxID=2656787 RepID=A0A370TUZ0_9HELO|nr:Uncharacterized protein BP5553_03684 [Venustampulla echinocandica]RDL39344.1 Uncharacterized protein BP5553_03684 [Venustampulla echinocandica]
MPFIPHTPESLLSRSDSKNPAVTCRGLTSNGRSCRRAISKSPQSSPGPSSPGVLNPEGFCWQHQDQAAAHTSPSASPQRRDGTIRERTSVDTLVDRLGLLEVEQRKARRRHQRSSSSGFHNKKATNDGTNPPQISEKRKPPDMQRPKRKPRSNLVLLCCIGEVDESRKAPRPIHKPGGDTTVTISTHNRSSIPTKEKFNRPLIDRDPSSQTGEFLSLIPAATPPQTTALLLVELAKPVSENDDEGFIYMFWLTLESLPADPPSETASSLLAPPARPSHGHRRTSDVLNTFSSTTPNTQNRKTMLLKIGRAQNVQRRLNQWTRQCGYNLSLIRYYPYHPTTMPDGNETPRTPRKVPNAHKVERLIHIELNAKRAQNSGKCGACGREHREWFEVDASREGVKAVDAVIRRWVDWGERQASR